MSRSRWIRIVASLSLPLMFSGVAVADSVWVKNLERANVKILDVKDGQFSYEASGGVREVPLTDVGQIKIDGDATLNAAEEAFKAQDWEKATAGYEKTMTTTRKPWLKEWCTVRLLESASKSGRFDAAVKAFISLAEKSPESAKTVSLEMPKADSKFLDDAVRSLDSAVKATKKEDTKAVLLGLLVEVTKAKGDTKGAESALQAMADAAIAADPNSPEALRAKVQLTLQGMRKALEAKQYDAVTAAAQKDGAAIVDPADQAEALLILADVQAAKLGNGTDAEAWKEAAVSYMRVVTVAPQGSPQAAQAMLKVAAIHETKLNEKPTALKLYEHVAGEYKGQEAAKEAEKQAARLKQG